MLKISIAIFKFLYFMFMGPCIVNHCQ